MKLSIKKMRVKDPKQLTRIIETNNDIILEQIWNKIENDPNIILNKKEIDCIKSSIFLMRDYEDNLDFYLISQFICATRDSEFIKQCLENKKIPFEDYQMVNMMKATNDVGFIKQVIEEQRVPMHFVSNMVEYLTNLESFRDYSKYIAGLITSNIYTADIKTQLIKSIRLYDEVSDDLYKDYVEFNMEDEKSTLDSSSKVDLILSMKELEKMKSKVKSKDGKIEYPLYDSYLLTYLKSDKLGLTNEDKVRLILNTNEQFFYTQCILDKEINLDSTSVTQIIQAYQYLPNVEPKKYVKIITTFIRQVGLNIDSYDLLQLVKSLDKYPELKEANIENEKYGFLSQSDCLITTVLREHLKGNRKMEVSEIKELLNSCSNIELLEDFLKSKILPAEYRAEVILATGNKEFILRCVENEKLYLGPDGRTRLLMGLDDPETVKEYIKKNDFLKTGEKFDLIMSFKDEEYIKQCIEDKDLNLSPVDKALLIAKGIKDEDYIKACLQNKNLGLDIMAYDGLIDAVGSEAEKEEWNSRFLRIKKISDISLEELTQTDKSIIEISDGRYPFYTKEEFIEIKKKVEEILEGIEVPQKGNEQSELNAFLEIAKRLANHMSYDQFAISKEGKKDHTLQRECRSLYGGLVNGECVCAGYANILKEILACVGIESKYISGFNEESVDGHAWNQVKIGEKWYNVDLTWERNEIVRTGMISKEILKSDQEFEDHMQYSRNRTPYEEKCINSMKIEKSVQKEVETDKTDKKDKKDKKDKNNQSEVEM